MGIFKVKKMGKVITTVVFLLFNLPQNGTCSPTRIEQIAFDLVPFKYENCLPALHIDPNPLIAIERSFDNLAETICLSQDPLSTTRQFFYAFLSQLNSQNGTSLKMGEICELLRENIALVPIEYREIFLIAIDSIKPNTNNEFFNTAATIYWPWEWNWFGFNKKEKEQQQPLAGIKLKIPSKIFIFGLIVAGVTVVAIFNPAAVALTTKALAQAAPAFF